MSTLQAIETAVEKAQGTNNRVHLGASMIGESCERKLWYTFRWATSIRHGAKLLRLFARGHREESTFIDLLRNAGVKVLDTDKRTGKQFTFSAFGGHFGGSMDALLKNIPESPGEWVVAEFKTSGDKAFKDLENRGVQESKPLHYAQVQCYMKWTNTRKALYLAVNKNDDSLHAEVVTFAPDVAESLLMKAQRIIASDRPPTGISNNGTYFECKWCDHRGTCHERKVAAISCRTCIHATPETDGEHHARWSCRRHKRPSLTQQEQEQACEQHRFIPDLVPFAEAIAADANGDTITYQLPDGNVFHNGRRGVLSYPSTELARLPEAMAADKNLDYLRNQFDGWVVR